jgi:hypothetical protein
MSQTQVDSEYEKRMKNEKSSVSTISNSSRKRKTSRKTITNDMILDNIGKLSQKIDNIETLLKVLSKQIIHIMNDS